jgi:flagellar basal body rod protein FlgB
MAFAHWSVVRETPTREYGMLNRLFGAGTSVTDLRAGLNRSTSAVREIAHRVANASSDPSGGFASALEDAGPAGPGEAVDLEKEMVALADEQIRYEATARLLEKVYQQIRLSIREG